MHIFKDFFAPIEVRPIVFPHLREILGFGNLTLMMTMMLAMRFVSRRRGK